jgi:hypothetical protein
VKPFRYLRDPLCLLGCGLYATNRWLVKPHVHVAFFQFWFNDSLLIPCALPPLLRVHAWLGWRQRNAAPTGMEILGHLLGWSVLFEVIGPHIMRATGDVWDVVAYSVGAVMAYLWWQRAKFFPKITSCP